MADASTFDLFDFISGVAYPEDSVRVYTDRKSVYDLDKLETAISNERDSARADELDAEAAALKESIRSSSLTFHLKGLPAPVVQDVDKRVDAKYGETGPVNERNQYRVAELLALHITSVEKADGAKDERAWDADAASLILNSLPDSQAGKLINGVVELTLKSHQFEEYEVTPDFS